MIRSRLRITLLMVLAVVVGLGIGSMLLVNSHTRRFESLIDEELRSIMAAQTITFQAGIIGSHALGTASSSPGGNIKPNDPVLDQASETLNDAVASLDKQSRAPSATEAVSELIALVEALNGEISKNLDPIAADSAVPQTDAGQIADLAGRIAMVSQRIATLNDSMLLAERSSFARQTRDAALYVGLLLLVALLILVVLYWQFNSLALQPLATLTDSVREVENRNFELSLPVHRDDEIGRLSHAYNDMAAELRRLYHETDSHIVDLNARNRALLTAFPHGIVVLKNDSSLVQVNPEAESLLESLGTPSRLPSKLQKIFDEVLESNEEYLPEGLEEALLFRIDDREVYYLPRVFRLPAPKDADSTWGIILTDVTRFRWLDDMKMNVLGTISHEIKTPLTSIRMILHLLLEQKTGDLNKIQEEMVSSASSDCERLLETLQNLLQLSRHNSGSKHLNLSAVPPASLFANIPLSLENSASEKGVNIQVKSNGNLPLVSADEARIAQVVTNLLSNAVKFSPPESAVTMKTVKVGADFVRFKFTDEGPGVPPEAQDRIFERFFRQPDQSHEGTGLGLSICREIIDAHDGRIGFSSNPGEPTTFYFDLPIA